MGLSRSDVKLLYKFLSNWFKDLINRLLVDLIILTELQTVHLRGISKYEDNSRQDVSTNIALL